MANLFLELFGEEIPAKMQESSKEELIKKLLDKISENFGAVSEQKSWVTPRRIAFYFEGLNLKVSNEKTEEVRGPKVNAPEVALNGFLAKHQVVKEDLTVKSDYYYLEVISKALDPKQLIKQLVEDTLKEFVWTKSMRWNEHLVSWVRPLKSMVCLLDNQVLPVKFGHITASNITYGHRFHAPQEIIIRNAVEYPSQMLAAHVMLKRQESILHQITTLSNSLGLSLIEDKELLDEVAGLVEFPFIYLGTIDKEFMSLPKEVLIITLKHHQRYFMLQDKANNIAPYYIIVSNVRASDEGAEIIKGNNKVLRARLSDAKFFVETDKRHTLISRLDNLKDLTFHQKIGSVYEKVQRMKNYGTNIAKQLSINIDKVVLSCDLAKVDLLTYMVREFPELQGVMGYYYATYDGVEEDVAIAIREHYKPQGPSDKVPSNELGAIVAIADKLDTLNEMFAINVKPTGSKDPFALRRAAIGIIRIIDSQPKLHKVRLGDMVNPDVREFILERAKVMLDNSQISPEIYQVVCDRFILT